jgi:hypothetical protein
VLRAGHERHLDHLRAMRLGLAGEDRHVDRQASNVVTIDPDVSVAGLRAESGPSIDRGIMIRAI